ncbi:MAG: phosphoribosylamine--glycine ligase [Thermodesulfobacteriota bacterium]
MKILIIGSGGREHALAWKISKSPLVEKIFIAPGNAGTLEHGENVAIKADDIEGLKAFALKERIGLTVVGPEVPLTLGIVDEFEMAGLKIFGPSKKAAEIEGSKVFSKELMKKYGLSTATYKTFSNPDEATEYAKKETHPLVIKADGLAAGKGVIISQNPEETVAAIRSISKDFGDAGKRIIIEEFLRGEEASFLVITDGKTILPLASAQDHKTVFDNDLGPNTGGMGAYSPAPVITKELEKKILSSIMLPTIEAMEKEGRPYKGVLYAGLMITDKGPKVLEFNARFGDPETQPILARLKTDLVPVMLAAIEGTLDKIKLEWDSRASVCVVMVAKGYPGSYEKGKEIIGLIDAGKTEDAFIFHAGTAVKNNKTITDGGRVLGVTALGSDIKSAVDKAYSAAGKINFDGAHYRKDIGKKALKQLS